MVFYKANVEFSSVYAKQLRIGTVLNRIWSACNIERYYIRLWKRLIYNVVRMLRRKLKTYAYTCGVDGWLHSYVFLNQNTSKLNARIHYINRHRHSHTCRLSYSIVFFLLLFVFCRLFFFLAFVNLWIFVYFHFWEEAKKETKIRVKSSFNATYLQSNSNKMLYDERKQLLESRSSIINFQKQEGISLMEIQIVLNDTNF